jgi:hypothetical protein
MTLQRVPLSWDQIWRQARSLPLPVLTATGFTQFGTLPDDMARANMTAIAQEVLPYFRDRAPQRRVPAAAE